MKIKLQYVSLLISWGLNIVWQRDPKICMDHPCPNNWPMRQLETGFSCVNSYTENPECSGCQLCVCTYTITGTQQ
jgi:hypothetical protein